MAKSEEKKPEEKIEVSPLEEQWNKQIDLLIEFERRWEEYRQTYLANRNLIPMMHPLDQRVMHRVVHKMNAVNALDNLAGDARIGFDKLLIGNRRVR